MSKYFTKEELIRSSAAAAAGLDNTPPPEALEALDALAERLLDPVRAMWGSPLAVNSGYRSAAVNALVGGTPRSQHLRGEAADITAGSPEKNRLLFEMIAASDLEFDSLIDERGYRWLHLSYRAGANRRQILHL